MRVVLITLFVLLSAWATTGSAQGLEESEPVAFHIRSSDPSSAVQGFFEGEYRIHPASIEVQVTTMVVRINQGSSYKGRRLLGKMRMGLVTSAGGGGLKTVVLSKAQYIGRVMEPGDEYTYVPFRFSIPKRGSLDLSKHWLVVQFENALWDIAGEEGKPEHISIASAKDIFL
jgi:hypothetical protein